MNKKSYKIETKKALPEIIDSLDAISNKKASYIYPMKGMYLIGECNNNTFSYKSYDSPPLNIKGKITENDEKTILEFDISFIKGSLREMLNAIIYPIIIPLIFIIIIWQILVNPGNIAPYVIGAVLIIAIEVIKKIIVYLNPEPRPDDLANKFAESIGENLI
jgi:hypothetical protein